MSKNLSYFRKLTTQTKDHLFRPSKSALKSEILISKKKFNIMQGFLFNFNSSGNVTYYFFNANLQSLFLSSVSQYLMVYFSVRYSQG